MIFDAHMHLPCNDDCVTLHDKKKRLLHDIKIAGVVGGIVISDSDRESSILCRQTSGRRFLAVDAEKIFILSEV